jgi:hypothetical protein
LKFFVFLAVVAARIRMAVAVALEGCSSTPPLLLVGDFM